ncbi:MAG: TIGR02757 family protein [Bacteroidales bacterium]|nr:TIGR02757 family protein [Bacteroidales bacterium]
MRKKQLKEELDLLALRYGTPLFVKSDPLQFLWRFTEHRDIEITAVLVAANTWGRRDLIIRACNRLMNLMDNSPSHFVSKELYEDIPDEDNVYRTFFGRDLKYFCRGLNAIYREHGSLETLFAKDKENMWNGIALFRETLRQANEHGGYNKHLANPATSACKRLHLMLRWLVRDDRVDRGLWKQISPKHLMIPMDTHVFHTARKMGLLKQPTPGRAAVESLTHTLRAFDPNDPVKYDFALFGYGIEHHL